MVAIIDDGRVDLVRKLPSGEVKLLVLVTDADPMETQQRLARALKRVLAAGGRVVIAGSLDAASEYLA